MDTAMHAAAVPDAERSSLKRPETAAQEIAVAIAAVTGGLTTPANLQAAGR
jgi:hypothetical protein